MIDLLDIVPSVTQEFNNLLEPLVGQCTLKTLSPAIVFDETYQQLNTTLDWDCGLFRTADLNNNLLSNVLINLELGVSIGYRVVVQQIDNKLNVRIASAELLSSNWM